MRRLNPSTRNSGCHQAPRWPCRVQHARPSSVLPGPRSAPCAFRGSPIWGHWSLPCWDITARRGSLVALLAGMSRGFAGATLSGIAGSAGTGRWPAPTGKARCLPGLGQTDVGGGRGPPAEANRRLRGAAGRIHRDSRDAIRVERARRAALLGGTERERTWAGLPILFTTAARLSCHGKTAAAPARGRFE